MKKEKGGQRLSRSLGLGEPLDLGGGGRTGARPIADKLEEVFELFPRLKERRPQGRPARFPAGEGQMLAVARALMQEPKVLLLDEPSAGLSPIFVEALFSSIAETRKERGVTIVPGRAECRQDPGNRRSRDGAVAGRDAPPARSVGAVDAGHYGSLPHLNFTEVHNEREGRND